jgi:hypothetical protein
MASAATNSDAQLDFNHSLVCIHLFLSMIECSRLVGCSPVDGYSGEEILRESLEWLYVNGTFEMA